MPIVPLKCFNHVLKGSKIISKGGRWLPMTGAKGTELFEKVNECDRNRQDILHDMKELENLAFTD